MNSLIVSTLFTGMIELISYEGLCIENVTENSLKLLSRQPVRKAVIGIEIRFHNGIERIEAFFFVDHFSSENSLRKFLVVVSALDEAIDR